MSKTAKVLASRRSKSGPQKRGRTSRTAQSLKPVTKHDQILELLRRKEGATIEEIGRLSGWQNHSVRGFLSGTVKKRLGLSLQSDTAKDGVRRYRIAG